MKIADDKLVFEGGDFETFTPEVQKALALYTGPRLAPETILINEFNDTVQAALIAWKKQFVAEISPLAEALALEKDVGKVAQVEALIEQAKVLLNVKDQMAVSLNPVAQPPILKMKE